MFPRSIVSALAIAATFSHAALGASSSDRKIVRLARGYGGPSAEGNGFVSAWVNLSPAFSHCHQTIQSHVEAQVAIQAVNDLAERATAVASQYGDINGHFVAEGPHACVPCMQQFQGIVGQIFVSLQGILSLGVQIYGQQWNSASGPACDKLGVFIKIVDSLCVSLKIDLGGLLLNLHIDLNVFVGLGINLNVLITGLVGGNGLLGGLLGGGAGAGLLGGVLR